jgi:SAM-dependent methyltransferase
MSTPAPALVPPVPQDYYARIYAVERGHWWHRGMREITAALLGERLTGAGTILDAGCGTGGFLAWAGERAPGARLLGADVSEQAVALARTRVPGAQVALAPLHAMPFENGTADLVACNDVLQHVREPELEASVAELRRVTRPGGALVVRTGGARCARAEREDWRIFDAAALRALLEDCGLRVQRVTYANLVGSAWAQARGGAPRAPTDERHGIPPAVRGRAGDPRFRLLQAEAAWLARRGRTLPFGHTLLALATR